MSTQTAKVPMPLIDIIRNAAGPRFAINESNGVYRVKHKGFEFATMAEMSGGLLVWLDPALRLDQPLPGGTSTECMNAIERIKANYHFASCEPDGRGPYD